MPTWSGLWNRQYNEPYAPLSGGNTTDYNNTIRNELAKDFRGPAGRKLGAIVRALTGAAVGAGTALSQVRQIPASPDVTASFSGGGKVTAVTVTEINRLTVAADETYVDGTTQRSTAPTYPVDKAGNGGYKGPGIF